MMRQQRAEFRCHIGMLCDVIDAVSGRLNALQDPERRQLMELLLATEMVADYIRRRLWEDGCDV